MYFSALSRMHTTTLSTEIDGRQRQTADIDCRVHGYPLPAKREMT